MGGAYVALGEFLIIFGGNHKVATSVGTRGLLHDSCEIAGAAHGAWVGRRTDRGFPVS